MAFLHHDIGDSRLIVFFQFDARISDGQELIVENLHTEIIYEENADITLLLLLKKSTFAVVGQSNSVVATFYITFHSLSYLWQLSFRNSISVENDARRLEPGGFVELNQQLSHHVRQILNDLLPGSLDSHRGTISAGMSVHTAYHLENSGLMGRVYDHLLQKCAKDITYC